MVCRMKTEFEKPIIPDFVKTKQGKRSLRDLTQEEIKQFLNVLTDAVWNKYYEND